MSDCGPETSLIDWDVDHAESLTLFQELRVEYSCGDNSLEFACSERELNLQLVLSLLERTIGCNRDDVSNL